MQCCVDELWHDFNPRFLLFRNAYFRCNFKRLCGLNNIEDQLEMTVLRRLVDESVTKHRAVNLIGLAVMSSTVA